VILCIIVVSHISDICLAIVIHMSDKENLCV
jgi:hypothetical protein